MTPKFDIADFVYVRHDPEQNVRQITGVVIRKGAILYECSMSNASALFYEFELSYEKNQNIVLGIAIEKDNESHGI